MIVYGIDPGLSGAIARFDLTEGFLEIHDMPIMEVNKKKSVSPQLVADILRQQHAPVYIEKVGAMPGQGVSSMFSFGTAQCESRQIPCHPADEAGEAETRGCQRLRCVRRHEGRQLR